MQCLLPTSEPKQCFVQVRSLCLLCMDHRQKVPSWEGVRGDAVAATCSHYIGTPNYNIYIYNTYRYVYIYAQMQSFHI